MPQHAPFADADFGTATWDADAGEWTFTVAFPSGRMAEGSLRPWDSDIHLSSPDMAESRACVRWVRANETTLLRYVADKMYQLMLDWHDPEWGPVLTKDEFAEKLALTSVFVEDESASLQFSDAGCFGGHWITFSVGADGRLDEEPFLWG